MKTVRSHGLIVVALSLVAFTGCDVAPSDTAAAQEPAAPAPDTEVKEDKDHLISQVQSSDDTRQGVSVAAWKVLRHGITNNVTVIGMDFAGVDSNRMEITRSPELFTIAIDGGAISISKTGQVLQDTLTVDHRRVLEFMSADLKDAGVQYGKVACGAAILATIATSVACGTGGWGCLGIPWAFCTSSKHCGNNACDA
jgi:hypothetical protein